MRAVLLVLAAICGILLAAFLYQQAVVEGTLGPSALIGIALLGTALVSLLAMYVLAGTRHRDTVGKILLAAASAAVAYVVLDVVAGWALIRPLSPPLVRDPIRHHRLLPNSYAELRQRDFAYLQRVNNLGLRGADTTLEKPAGTIRVLMLGDSFTMGKGVEDDETFSALLERSLQRAMDTCGGPRVEVLNAGIDSYAPILSYLHLKSELLQLGADVVVLNLDNSDLVQETVYRRDAVFDPDGEPLAVPSLGQDSLYERIRSWTERNLFFTRILLVYANRAFSHGSLTVRQVVNELGREHFAHTLEGDVDRTEEWQNVFDSLGRIRELTTAAGMDLVLTTYPWGHQVNEDEWVPGRFAFMKEGERTTTTSVETLRAFGAAQEIEVLELHPAFKAYAGPEKLYFDYDPHWTEAGHRVMAAGLEAYFAERYVPRWCAGD